MIPKTSDFICPICKGRLFESETGLKCFLSHSFDKAKQGYVNLLLSSAGGKRHGDDKLMLSARRNFLEKKYYSPLRNTVAEILGSGNTVLDCGCGEGYYTVKFAESNKVIGIDISKDAVRYAASVCKNGSFAVASISSIPLADESVDKIVSIFAPDSPEEFCRVLKNNGRLITVLPMENHLIELKTAVYDKPYINPPPNTEKAGFKLIETRELKYQIQLQSNADIQNLFKMTPYYYKTSVSDQQKLNSLNRLNVRLEFLIAEYQKK